MAVFNVIAFFARPYVPSKVNSFGVGFWVTWTFVIVSFIGNIVGAFFAFKGDNLKKVFLNIPLIVINWSSLIVMLLIGIVLILIPGCPAWVSAIVCSVVLAINVVSIVKAMWAAETISNIDENVKAQTSFKKNLTVDADDILARAKSDEVKAECKKVYEAIRYSDPMSNEALSAIEEKITLKMDELSSVVGADDAEKAKEIADEIIILVGDRNKKCKALK